MMRIQYDSRFFQFDDNWMASVVLVSHADEYMRNTRAYRIFSVIFPRVFVMCSVLERPSTIYPDDTSFHSRFPLRRQRMIYNISPAINVNIFTACEMYIRKSSHLFLTICPSLWPLPFEGRKTGMRNLQHILSSDGNIPSTVAGLDCEV